jgi:hypothetical protein
VQTQVVWQAEQLHRDVQERKQEVDHLRVSSASSNAQRSVGDVDNDLDTVEADKAAEERAKDELVRRQGRLRCAPDGLHSSAHHILQSVGHQLGLSVMVLMTQMSADTCMMAMECFQLCNQSWVCPTLVKQLYKVSSEPHSRQLAHLIALSCSTFAVILMPPTATKLCVASTTYPICAVKYTGMRSVTDRGYLLC